MKKGKLVYHDAQKCYCIRLTLISGVCISTSACSASGGTSVAGGCPGDPANVRCCTKPSCGKAAVDFNALNEEQMPISAATAGNCRWQNDCAGKSEAGLCPGPSRFRCCDSASNGWGGYSKPIEHYGGCQKVAIDGAKAAIKAWPGRVREVFCKRTCRDSSDHCDGKATDLMISDGSSVRFPCCFLLRIALTVGSRFQR